jgi:serine/threonine protein kinase
MALPAKDETLRGYLLTSDFKMAGGGTCQWTFATKDSKDFFIKVFLDPTLPKPGGLGGEKTKEQRKQKCLRFERHQRELMEKVKKVVGPGGRLVAPIEFFEHDGRYYKVAHKVTVSPGAETEITTRSLKDRLNLCINVVSALQSLHKAKIVHGDLKLENILIEKAADGAYTARVIDFDSSYIVGAPPASDEILGDPPYYSPELLDYIQEKVEPEKLTTASDIFSLGIVFTRYLTGDRPQWSDGSHNYLAEAVRAGITPTFKPITSDEGKGEVLRSLILRMLSRDPSSRPDLFTLRQELINIRDGSDTTGGVGRVLVDPPKPPTPTSGSTGKPGLRIGKGLKEAAPAAGPADIDDSAAPASASVSPEEPATGLPGDADDGSVIEPTVVPELPADLRVEPVEPVLPVVTPSPPSGSATGDVGELIRQATELLARIAAASTGAGEKPVSRLKVSKDLMKGEPTHDDSRVVELQAVVDALRKIAG